MGQSILGAVMALFLLPGAAQAANVKIGAIVAMSGPNAQNGAAAKNGAELALRDMKRELDARGLSVTIGYSDETTATSAATAAKAFVDDPSVLGIFGPTFSGAVLLARDITGPANLAMVSGTAAAADLTGSGFPNVNRIVARSDAEGAAMAEYLAESTGLRRVLLVSNSTTFGNSLVDDFSEAAAREKLTVVGRVNLGEKPDYNDVIDRARAARPDLIYYGGLAEGAADLLGALRGAGVTTTFAGGSALASASFLGKGALARGTFFTSSFGPITKFSRAFSFKEQYEAAYRQPPNIFALFAYDSTRVLLKALVAAARTANGVPSRAQVMAAVRRVNLPDGLSGAIAFDDRGERTRTPLFLMQVSETTGAPELLEVRIVRPKRNP